MQTSGALVPAAVNEWNIEKTPLPKWGVFVGRIFFIPGITPRCSSVGDCPPKEFFHAQRHQLNDTKCMNLSLFLSVLVTGSSTLPPFHLCHLTRPFISTAVAASLLLLFRLCFGIYDANCDGPSWENPVKIIKVPRRLTSHPMAAAICGCCHLGSW